MPALTLQTTPLEDALLPRMDPSEISDRIMAMRYQEETVYRCEDYLELNDQLLATTRKAVDEDCRVKMCEWCYQVVDFCRFRRETVAVGINYLDRFVSSPAGSLALCDRKTYQLAAMTTLYMAIKLHEPLEMETSLLADLSRGCYSEAEIAEMENKILKALKWRLHGPTSLSFVQHFLALLPTANVHPAVPTAIMDYARFQSELAVSDYTFVTTPHSHIALASVFNALDGIDTRMLPLKSQGKFLRDIERVSGIIMEEVVDVQHHLNNILVDVYTEGDSVEVSPAAESNGEQLEEQSYQNSMLSGSTASSRRSGGSSKSRSKTTSPGQRASPVSIAT